jgi:hypothetical protein
MAVTAMAVSMRRFIGCIRKAMTVLLGARQSMALRKAQPLHLGIGDD